MTRNRQVPGCDFQQRVEALLPQSTAYAFAIVRSREDAEDAVQEAAVKAYQRFARYDRSRPFRGWWLAILRNCCRDVLRRRRMNYLSFDELPPMVELSMPRTTQPEQVVVSQQDASAVQRLLDTLPPAYRIPVVLRYWYDMSYREIAETMGVTESTIKTRLHRARAKLACQSELIRQSELARQPERARHNKAAPQASSTARNASKNIVEGVA